MADYVGTVDEGKEITLYGTGWGVLGTAMASSIAFCVGGILITTVLFRHPVISPKGPCLCFFSANGEVIALGATVLRMVAVSEPFYGFSIIVEGFMQGVGKTKAPFVYNIIGMWGIRIVGTFICTQCLGLGLVSAWACMILHNLLLFVLFLISYRKGIW